MRVARPVLVAIVLTALAGARSALSADAPAVELFRQGTAALEAGRYEEACPALEQSYRVEPMPGTLFHLAECEAMRGRIASAVKRYKEYLAMYPKLSRQSRAVQNEKRRPQQARRQVEALEPDVPLLTLVLPDGASPDTVIQCDGEQVPKDQLGKPFALDPGEHVVTTWVPGEVLSQFNVKLGKGDKLLLRLTRTSKSSAPSKAEPTPEPPTALTTTPADADEGGPSAARRASLYIVGGVGLAGLVFGGITGGLAIAKDSEAHDTCSADAEVGNESPCASPQKAAQATTLAEDSRKLGNLSTIGFIAGGVGVGAALVLLLTEPRPKPSPASARGASIGVNILAAGPDGALLGIKGVW